MENRIYDSTEKLGPEYLPYLQGKDVARYRIGNPSYYLRYGPWLAEPQSLDRFSCPRILLREVLGKAPYFVQAAYSTDTLLYNKSVLHIKAGAADPKLLWALLAVLNSKTGSLLLKLRGRKSLRRLFPKIVKADLDDLLIPRMEGRALELVALGEALQGNPDKTDLEDLTERTVLAVYGLPYDALDKIDAVGKTLP